MEMKTKRLYEFGPFRLDPEEAVLFQNGKPVYLKPKVFETLLVLVENRGRLLDKEMLMQRLWQDSFVEEANLTVNISQIRKALGQSEDGDQLIETLPRRGYRFVGEVREVLTEGAAIVVKEYTSSHITIEERQDEEPGAQNGVAPAEMSRLSTGRAPTVAESGLLPTQSVRNRKLVVTAVAALVVGVTAFGLYRLLQTSPTDGSQTMKLTRLTHIGRVWRAAISPDGKYVAYVSRETGKQSLWVRQVATTANVEIVPPAAAIYWGLKFSPDGDHIYFARSESTKKPAIYKVAVLGGPIVKLIETVNAPFAVSPDGGQFAYVRQSEARNEAKLILANADGSGERILTTRRVPDFFSTHRDGIAWSPDGKTIACHAGGTDAGGYYHNVVGVHVEDGSETPITSRSWKWIGGLAWLADSTGLFLNASDDPAGWDTRQIWQIAYPSGEARRITNDLSGYVGLSATGDALTLLTVQETDFSNLWIVPDAKIAQARPLTAGDSDGQNGLAWTPDGKRIVYTSKATGRNDLNLWIMDADGGNQKPLTTASGAHEEPAVTVDGRYVVYSARAPNDLSANIWRIDIDGSNPKQLTHGRHDVRPQCSEDGKWVLFTHRVTPTSPTLWKVSIEGGEPVLLHDEFTFGNGISPDGKLIACGYYGQKSNGHSKIAILPVSGGPPLKLFDIPPGISPYDLIQWTPDGRALICGGASTTKIWIQPLDGGPPKELIDFQADSVWRFAWSPQGNTLAVARGSVVGDVVLISR